MYKQIFSWKHCDKNILRAVSPFATPFFTKVSLLINMRQKEIYMLEGIKATNVWGAISPFATIQKLSAAEASESVCMREGGG